MKKFIVPLQAFASLLLCAGMGWMVFVLASINPTPPTIKDLQARNTQDLSFANMNSTAVALAQEMLADMMPTASGRFFLPLTGRETATPSPVVSVTLRALSTFANPPTPFPLISSLFPPTPTRKKPDRPADTPTLPPPTPVPTQTMSPSPTPPATETSTGIPTETPTNAPAPTPTDTPDTPTPTPGQEPTAIPTEAEPTPIATSDPVGGTPETPVEATP